jgi:hypothetical protein
MELNVVPLSSFDIQPTTEDLFWQEKTLRFINECDSVFALKEAATSLTKIAAMRQAVIRGLVKDIKLFNHVVVDEADLANPPID